MTSDASRQTPNIGTQKPKVHQILQANKLQLHLLLNYNYLHAIILYRVTGKFTEKKLKIKNVY